MLSNIMRLYYKVQRFYGPENQSRFFQRLSTCHMSINTSEVNIKESFDKVWPSVMESLVKGPRISEIPEIGEWLQEAQSYLLVADDMIDGSSTRRGKPCWYKLPHVDIGAVNDAQLLKFSIYECLKMHFKMVPLYNNMVDLYNEAMLYTSMGQHLDYTMTHRIKSDYSLFTIGRYNSIVKYKTAYYSFKLPILLGYLLANNSDESLHRKVEEVCLMLGRLAQIQNDYLDLYEESVSGKNGTDIQEGKCSWLAVHALKHSNDAQRAFFIENYADKDPAKVQNIKNLYEELKLQELYKVKQNFLFARVLEKANGLPARDKKLLLKFVDLNYKQKQYEIKG